MAKSTTNPARAGRKSPTKRKDAMSLPVERLRERTDAASLGIRTTDDIPPLEEFLGQARAVTAITFGLDVESKGYNIVVLGNPGSGRTTYSLERPRAAAQERPAPDDWGYVYNFDDPGQPLPINLPPGKGKAIGTGFAQVGGACKTATSQAVV